MPPALRLALLPSALLLGLSISASSSAVTVSPDGQGQVLIFPYYTVNKGLSTLIAITNTRAEPKAVRVRFREHRNGRSVLEFNLYLSANDTWTAAVVSSGPQGSLAAAAPPARLVTNDLSCTVPSIPAQGQDFLSYEYQPNAAGVDDDGGPYEPSRTREGFVEVIEMGRLVDVEGFAPASAVRPASSNGVPANCDRLNRAWWPFGPTGTWASTADPAAGNSPSRGIASPNGGLRGSMILVDPGQGISFSVAPTALDGFFEPSPACAPDCLSVQGENLHRDPAYLQPTLADARDAAGDASALIVSDNQAYRLRFSGPNAGLKATSAALMQASLSNEFNVERSADLMAESDWVVTLPTRHLHLALDTPSERLPFTEPHVGGNARQSPPYGPLTQSVAGCERVGARQLTRDGALPLPGFPMPTPPSTQRDLRTSLCSSVRVFSFGGSEAVEALQGGTPSPALGAFSHQGVALDDPRLSNGWLQLNLAPGSPFRNFLYSSATPDPSNPYRANAIFGLPAIGFWASNFFGSGTPGLLANYAIFAPHSGGRGLAPINVDVGADGSVSWRFAEP